MGTSAKNAKRKADLFEDDDDVKPGKRAKPFDPKGPLNAIQTEDLKNLSGPPSPASIPSFEGRKPAEIFRTDLISAMKLPDTHILNPGTYINITDPWRQEWERGVQVPVNPDNMRQPLCRFIDTQPKNTPTFKLPSKLLTPTSKKRSKTSSKGPYDLNRMDADWLASLNRTRYNKGLVELEEGMFEKSIAYLENQCYNKMGHAIATQAGLSIEYDESVCCDICQSPDSEEANEMVFCDNCDICVHQACYGIQNIPVGSWLCQPCRKGVKAVQCVLCPHSGGALKKTKNSKDWAHVSCSLWVPEVGFGSVEKMEPVTRVENIPQSRWNLVCSICRQKVGACIQCSVKSCVTAFHVTCGFKHGLEMKTLLDDSAADGVRHISYCMRHGYKNKSPDKRKEDAAPENAENLRQQRLKKMEEQFYKYVDVTEAAKDLGLPKELMKRIHAYWTLKRKAREDVPLLPPTLQQQQKLSGKQGAADASRNLEAQLHRLVKLRCNLERLRNLCYMVGKREKMSRDLYRVREQVFWKQHEMLMDETLSEDDLQWVVDTGRVPFTGGGAGAQALGPASSCSSAGWTGDRSSTDTTSQGGASHWEDTGASDSVHEATGVSSARQHSAGGSWEVRDASSRVMSAGSLDDFDNRKNNRPKRKTKRNPGDLCVGSPASLSGHDGPVGRSSSGSINGEVSPQTNQLQLDSGRLDCCNGDLSSRRKKKRARTERRRSGGTLSRTERSPEMFVTEDEPPTLDEILPLKPPSGRKRGARREGPGSASEMTDRGEKSPRRAETHRGSSSKRRRGARIESPRQAELVAADVSGRNLPSTRHPTKTRLDNEPIDTASESSRKVPERVSTEMSGGKSPGVGRCSTGTQKENEPIDTTSERSRKVPKRARTEPVSRVIPRRDHEASGLPRAKPGKAPSKRVPSRGKTTDGVTKNKQAFITDFLRRRTPLRSRRSGGRQDPDSPAVSPRQSCAKTFANGAETHEHGACPNCQAQHDRHSAVAADSPADAQDPDEPTPSRRLRGRGAQSPNSRAPRSKEGLSATAPHCCESLMAKFLVK